MLDNEAAHDRVERAVPEGEALADPPHVYRPAALGDSAC